MKLGQYIIWDSRLKQIFLTVCHLASSFVCDVYEKCWECKMNFSRRKKRAVPRIMRYYRITQLEANQQLHRDNGFASEVTGWGKEICGICFRFRIPLLFYIMSSFTLSASIHCQNLLNDNSAKIWKFSWNLLFPQLYLLYTMNAKVSGHRFFSNHI